MLTKNAAKTQLQLYRICELAKEQTQLLQIGGTILSEDREQLESLVTNAQNAIGEHALETELSTEIEDCNAALKELGMQGMHFEVRKQVRFTDTDPNEEANAALESAPKPEPLVAFTPFEPFQDTPNTQIYEYNNEMLDDQDRQLDSISQSVSNQRSMGQVIYDELTSQNGLVDQLDTFVDHSQQQFTRAVSNLKVFNERNRGCGTLLIIAVLTLLLIIVIII